MKNHPFAILIFSFLLTVAPAYADGGLSDELARRVEIYRNAFAAANSTKPDPEALKKLLGYYLLTQKDRGDLNEATKAMAQLSPMEWSQLVADASAEGASLFRSAVDDGIEENPHVHPGTLVDSTGLADSLKQVKGDFVRTDGGIVFSQQRELENGASPILLGGGFPFNQTQFGVFNDKLTHIATLDLYDPVCTGLSVLFDAIENQGNECRAYRPSSPRALFQDELAYEFARSLVLSLEPMLSLSLDQTETAIFRLARLTFHGVSLAQQAHALETLADVRGYRNGEALLAGLSYGGLVVGKMGAMYPGRYKALVLFSPGVENPAHLNANRDIDALLELSYVQRRVLANMVTDIANSPRYDAYLPDVLKNNNQAFRESLMTKMLGELDLDLRADLAKVRDRVYMITGALDGAIDPHTQIDAMRVVFRRAPIRGSYVLVPQGGHALWGNPAQSDEAAVVRVLEEIEKGTGGAFEDGGVYAWNESAGGFDRIGSGIEGLAAADALVDQLKSAIKK